MLRNVVALLGSDTVPAFELGVACEVFGVDRSGEGLPKFDFAVCSPDDRSLTTSGGLTLRAAHRLDRAAEADLVVIPTWARPPAESDPAVVEVLHAAVERGATVLSVCTGAYLLAAAGLLDGRRATCHWRDAEDLALRFPEVDLTPDRLYVEDGPVITSAGTAAGIDACLYLVRRELGARVANGIARRMVVPPHRDGGQAQYVDAPVPSCSDDDLGPLLTWIQTHLHRDHTVPALAARAHQSPRTFARRFVAATGAAPQQWITRQRVLLAQLLLEEGELDIEAIARHTGFGSADLLRHHFTRQLHTSPTAYRATFNHRIDTA